MGYGKYSPPHRLIINVNKTWYLILITFSLETLSLRKKGSDHIFYTAFRAKDGKLPRQELSSEKQRKIIFKNIHKLVSI